MAIVTKFDILKFDGKISFHIWKVQMMAILMQNGLKKALCGLQGSTMIGSHIIPTSVPNTLALFNG